MQLKFPYTVTGAGRTATAGDHIREMIEQVLFTTPGERVNRPAFGTGLMELVFGAENDELLSATQMMVQGALQQWLGDVIEVEAVDVRNDEGKLLITVQYIERQSQQRRLAEYASE